MTQLTDLVKSDRVRTSLVSYFNLKQKCIQVSNKHLSNLSSQGYQIIEQLGFSQTGGRSTYKAIDNKTQIPVVIKHFQFNSFGSDWSGFKAYERELKVLQHLNHPGIPRFLSFFETSDGFCLVQEYKDAQSLALQRVFTLKEIQRIASGVLEILIYLQYRIPIVIHRDIKPENILVDEHTNVYLVDFGFAKVGSTEVGISSIAVGTLGFMPPEQLYNRPLTTATDLYGLGVTLICLLTGTKSTAIDSLIDTEGRINFKPLIPQIDYYWIKWLEKLIQPNPKKRYSSAATALEALKKLETHSANTSSNRSFGDDMEEQRSRNRLISSIICAGLSWKDKLIEWSLEKSNDDEFSNDKLHEAGIIIIEGENLTGLYELLALKRASSHSYEYKLTLHLLGQLQSLNLKNDTSVALKNKYIYGLELYGILKNGILDKATARYIVQHMKFENILHQNIIFDKKIDNFYRMHKEEIESIYKLWKKEGLFELDMKETFKLVMSRRRVCVAKTF